MNRCARATQPANLLAVDAGKQAHAAVRLLLILQGKIVLGDVHVKFAQEFHDHREGNPAADHKPHERTQQARQGPVQLGWLKGDSLVAHT